MRPSLVFLGALVGGCAAEPTLLEAREGADDTWDADADAPAAVDGDASHRCGNELDDLEVEIMDLEFQAAEAALGLPGGMPVPIVPGGVINVYFHVLHDGANGDLTQAQIDGQIAVMNTAYASTGWSFSLVSADWTDDRQWFSMNGPAEVDAKAALRQGTADDLNLYSAEPGQLLLGWATFPNEYTANPLNDGVVLHHGTVPGGGMVGYDLGATTIHEVGHWMGLLHTFQGGCFNTATTGDQVTDTPAEASANYDCVAGRDTCPALAGNDPITNFMDYSYDACLNRFSRGQDIRMDKGFTFFRYGK